MRKISRISVLSICVLGLVGAPSARATSTKDDVIALQAQVQQMQQMMISMQQTNDERYATMHNLLQQTTQTMAKISAEMDSMQKAVQDQQGAQGTSLQQLSGQMQSMNDSLDELRARLDKINTSLSAIQSQQQTLAAGQAAQPGQQPGQPTPAGMPGAGGQLTPGSPAAQPPAPQAPPVIQLYNSAASDYNSAKYNLASQEFADVIKFYPQSDEAAKSQFYLGEIDYRAGNYKGAIDNYSLVLSQYPGSSKAATAMLRKGESEVAMGERRTGIKDLRDVIYRYPQTPEAMQARSKLNAMGVRIYVKPSPGR